MMHGGGSASSGAGATFHVLESLYTAGIANPDADLKLSSASAVRVAATSKSGARSLLELGNHD